MLFISAINLNANTELLAIKLEVIPMSTRRDIAARVNIWIECFSKKNSVRIPGRRKAPYFSDSKFFSGFWRKTKLFVVIK